jgi:hypothetical protein
MGKGSIPYIAAGWLALGLVAATPAWAQPVHLADDPTAECLPAGRVVPEMPVIAAEPPPEGPEVRATGFLDSRWTGGYATVARLIPSNDVAHLQELTEANLQLKLSWPSGNLAYVDASFVHQRGWMYWGEAKDQARTRLADHDVPSLRPAAIVSEAYGVWAPHDRFNLTVGKKRVLWGPGLAWNPTDLLNPPKDPTDPTLQRAGTWLARAEIPMDNWSLSLVGAAKTTRQFGGLPSGLVTYPDNLPAGETSDDRPHFALAARLYALVAETDLNAMLYMTQLYNDAFEYKPRLGLSASHVFLDAIEAHAEVLLQTGSARSYFDGACTGELTALLGCVAAGKTPAGYTKLEDGEIRAKALAGVRWQFGENAAISAEYFFNGEGYDAKEFDSFAQALSLGRDARRLGMTLPAGAMGSFGPSSSDPGTPQKFAFEPLRRHYLFLTYLHPQLADDFTINTVVILGLADLSGQFAPQLTWSARQWLNLSIGAFVALPGLSGQGALAAGERWTEYGLQPSLGRVFTSARAFF